MFDIKLFVNALSAEDKYPGIANATRFEEEVIEIPDDDSSIPNRLLEPEVTCQFTQQELDSAKRTGRVFGMRAGADQLAKVAFSEKEFNDNIRPSKVFDVRDYRDQQIMSNSSRDSQQSSSFSSGYDRSDDIEVRLAYF